MRRPLLLVACLLLCATTLRADEVEPAERYRRAVAALSAPRGEQGFRVEWAMLVNGAPVGRCVLEAAPEGTYEWRVLERAEGLPQGDPWSTERTAFLGPSLDLLRGRVVLKQGDGEALTEWALKDGAYVVRRKVGGETSERKVEASGPALTTLTAHVLVGRLLPAEPGEYEVQYWQPDWDEARGQQALETASFHLEPQGTWREKPALLLVATRSGRTLVAAYDPATRAPVGLRLEDPSRGMTVLFQPPEAVEPPRDDPRLVAPARTPEDAAFKGAVGLFSGDLDLLSAAVHWPTWWQAFEVEHPGSAGDAEDFRRQMLEALSGNLAKRPRAAVVARLDGIWKDVARTEREDGIVEIRLPEALGGLAFRALKVGEAWLLADLPRK
jgi:hypothetical protein